MSADRHSGLRAIGDSIYTHHCKSVVFLIISTLSIMIMRFHDNDQK